MEFEPFTNKSRRLLNSDFVAENMRVGRIQSPIWPEMHQSFYTMRPAQTKSPKETSAKSSFIKGIPGGMH